MCDPCDQHLRQFPHVPGFLHLQGTGLHPGKNDGGLARKMVHAQASFPHAAELSAGHLGNPLRYCLQRAELGEEFPMQNFLDVEGANPGLTTAVNGLSFLNDGKSSGSIAGKEVSLTVLRSPIYANHEPYEPDENLEYVYIDQGVQTFTYALFPHDGSWENSHTVREAGKSMKSRSPFLKPTIKGSFPKAPPSWIFPLKMCC